MLNTLLSNKKSVEDFLKLLSKLPEDKDKTSVVKGGLHHLIQQCGGSQPTSGSGIYQDIACQYHNGLLFA